MLAQIRAFLVVLDEGSLNRAAARLRMSQSALSRQMQALEQEVGGPLLERTSAGVRPTDAGHALARSMPAALARFDAAFAEARTLTGGQQVQLRVGYLASAAGAYLNPALDALRRTHPGVRVTPLNLSPGEQVAALRRGEIDVALAGQEGCFVEHEFYVRKLATLRLLAVLPGGHPLAAASEISLRDLRRERFVSSPERDLPGRDRWITGLCRAAGFRPHFAQPADSLSQALTLVASEGVVTLVPDLLRGAPAAGVVMIPLSDPGAQWDLLVAWQRGRAAGPLRALIDALAAAAKRAAYPATAGGIAGAEGTKTHAIPAASAASTPAGLSSKTTHSPGGTPRRRAASKKGPG